MFNEWFDGIREWLFENNWRRFLGFFLIAFGVNSVIWNFLEPANINQYVKYYPAYHYGLVLILSAILFTRLLPPKVLIQYELNSDASSFDVNNWITTQDTHAIHIVNDNITGKSLQFKGPFSAATLFEMKGVSRKAKFIKLLYVPEQEFLIYLKVAVYTQNKSSMKEIWVGLKDNILKPYKISSAEWAIPVSPKIKSNKWFEISINLDKITKKGLGTDSLIYNELLGIQVRGTGLVNSVILYS
jgi:hypothetical protein